MKRHLLVFLISLVTSATTTVFMAKNATADDLELDARELAEIQEDANLNLDPRPSDCNLGTRDTLEVCDNTNKVRDRYRRDPVRSDALLNRLAMEYARQLYRYNNGNGTRLTHNIPGHEFSKRMRRGGVNPPYAENIAAGYRDSTAVVEGWRRSRGHLRNMVGSNYSKVGAAHYRGFWVQIFSR